VGDGYARSLSNPGGNFTGLSLQVAETTGKRLEVLKELVPGAAPVGVLWARPGGLRLWQAAEDAARGRGWKLLSLEIRGPNELGDVVKAATRARAGALLVNAGRPLTSQSRRVAELATNSRLPAMYTHRFFTENAGLISYGADEIEVWHRTAVFVDKILKGAKPGDLPIEQASKFELVINRKAAKAIGLTIPPLLLARADQVIE